MNKIISVISVFYLILAGGCAWMELPSPKEIVDHPLGTESVKIGMSRNQVRNLWGDPTSSRIEEVKGNYDGKREREVWVYKAKYGVIPVDAGYLSKTKYLYFDGDSLTNISETELKAE